MNTDTANTVPTDVDLIVLGSGVAGLTAALTAALEGLSCLVLEHSAEVGGTSARSSGTIWIPGNPYIADMDEPAKARAYLEALVGDKAPKALRESFLSHAPEMLNDLEIRAGLAFSPLTMSRDYDLMLPGAALGSRALEPGHFDGRSLGANFARLAAPIRELMLFGKIMITRPEAAALVHAERSIKTMALGTRLLARYAMDRLSGHARGTRLVMGNALVARLFEACLDQNVTVLTKAQVLEITRDNSKVTGLSLEIQGKTHRVEASKGIVLAGGGFPANPAMLKDNLPQPVSDWTPAARGCDGSTIALAQEIGAVLSPRGQDNALWFPSSVFPRRDGTHAAYPHIILDRAKPGSIIVGQDGNRFANEAQPYHYFGRAMYRANVEGAAIPAWIICGRDFIRRYGLGAIRPRTPILTRYLKSGYLIEGRDIGELAEKTAMPADALVATIARFNEFATQGVDEDFGRGESPYDQVLGDPEQGPNPCLGVIGQGPLYAVRLEPTPFGTSRGLATDAEARVLDNKGAVIDGLYACGNDMQSAFGGEYPGAGTQLGLAMTFAWLASRHAARRDI